MRLNRRFRFDGGADGHGPPHLTPSPPPLLTSRPPAYARVSSPPPAAWPTACHPEDSSSLREREESPPYPDDCVARPIPAVSSSRRHLWPRCSLPRRAASPHIRVRPCPGGRYRRPGSTCAAWFAS